MKLTHLGVSYYRSIGAEPVTIDLSKKITVLVGANNCGKSNVLSALDRVCMGDRLRTDLAVTDYHKRAGKVPPLFWLSITPEDDVALLPLGTLKIGWNCPTRAQGDHCSCDDFDRLDFHQFNAVFDAYARQRFVRHVTLEERQKKHSEICEAIVSKVNQQLPRCCVIPPFRQIKNGESYTICGGGVLPLLASWQHPEIGDDADCERFHRVQSLLRRLTESPEVGLEISHKRDEIIVRNGTLRLPLLSYGTGIHELIILAIAVVSQSNALVCIEEPEIHLHPLLQRRFLEFLRTETNNRYVITTHSPALIAPSEDTDVIHLWLEDGVTKSRRAETTADSLRALRDLGVKASDLLQANSVIWVEGPSDRIYLNHWLKLLAPDLREGIDYAVMFYGGRLLSHVSCERDEFQDADDLIQLLRINQHSAIIVDSDRRSADAPINPTKERICAECEKSDVVCWITEGKEIENSLSTEAIAAAYRSVTNCNPAAQFSLAPHDLIEPALEKWLGAEWKPKWSYDAAKPKMAREIIKHITAENIGDTVRERCEQLIAAIRHQPVTTGASPS